MARSFAPLALLLLADCGAAPPRAAESAAVPSEEQSALAAREDDGVIPALDTEEGSYFPGIPHYPNARFLCSQHITGTPEHISWSGYATADSVETVRTFYQSAFQAPSAHRDPSMLEPDGEVLRIRSTHDRVVSIYPAGSEHPTCDVAHSSTDRTYIVVSTMARPAS